MEVTITDGNDGILNLHKLVEGLERQSSRTPVSPVVAQKTPIVLVPGFTGWSEALFGTFNYWGGFEDIPSVLVNCGYSVIVVRIGPLSTNWERACEMYAQLANIRGGIGFDRAGISPATMIPVDYGKQNAASNRYTAQISGKSCQTKQAIVFGEIDPKWRWSESTPLNFICHSQGGNTMRELIKIMTGIYPSYFQIPNQQKWIKAAVTLATPHKGSTVTDIVQEVLPDDYLDIVARGVVSASFNKPPTPRFYDLQLDHLGFCRQGNEDFMTMYHRLRDSVGHWWESKRNGFFDNSIEGVALLNKDAAIPSKDVYFFTMSSDTTIPPRLGKITEEDLKAFGVPMAGLAAPIVNAGVSAFGFLYSKLPIIPSMVQAGTSAAIQVAERHLKAGGYYHNLPSPGSRVPRSDMLPLLAPTGFGMSGYGLTKERQNILGISSADFQPNDGVVNTLSMRGPLPLNDKRMKEVADFPLVMASRDSAKGNYWHFGKNISMDHADVIGVFTADQTWREVRYMYCLLARLFDQLP